MDDHCLATKRFYIPQLPRFSRPSPLPVSMSRFIALFRAEWSKEAFMPKGLDLTRFEDLADRLHLLVRVECSRMWKFERFAPSYIERIGVDLTGEAVNDPRFAPYNLRLDVKLDRLLHEQSPYYVGTRVDGLGNDGVLHRLLIPMSRDGRTITHCLLMSV